VGIGFACRDLCSLASSLVVGVAKFLRANMQASNYEEA
jgi:hypothetical protein